MATATAPSAASRQANGQAIAARAEAVKKLVANHADEFGKILSAERIGRGLSAESGGQSTNELLARQTKAQEKLDKIKADLAARGVSQ